MTSQNLDNKPLRRQTIGELCETLDKEFRKSENLLKAIEIELLGRHNFEKREFEGMCLPAINEFRYASRHIVTFLVSKNQEKDADELLDAILHCRRAQRDAQDCLFSIYLDMCRRILDRSRRGKLSANYPFGANFEEDCRELNRITRANLDTVLQDEKRQSVNICGSVGFEAYYTKKDMEKLIGIYDRFERAFFACNH